jgi:hypothetical protein
MKRLAYLSAVLLLTLAAARPALAEPAWGRNCLACHNQLQTGLITIIGEDTIADPDESATGAPDHGPLPVFQTSCGATRTLEALLAGLDTGDTYAVELTRMRFPGVESGGDLSYTGDCDWAEWDEAANQYTDPVISYSWGTGPDAFDFDIDVEPDADGDYYDLLFAVAGKFASTGELFYAQEHFYLQVVTVTGDINCDGTVGISDLALVLAAYNTCTGDANYNPAADLDDDGCIDLADLSTLLANYGTRTAP